MYSEDSSRLRRIYQRVFGDTFLGNRIRASVILKMLGQNGKMLDAGCGVGAYSITFAKRGFDVIGVDISKERIQQARQYAERLHLKNTEFILGDLRYIPLREKVFGTILCSEVLEHVYEDFKVLLEIDRVSQQYSTLIVTTPCVGISKYIRPSNHVREGYTFETLRDLLAVYGFNVVKYIYVLKFFGVKIGSIWKRMEGRHRLKLVLFPFAYLVCKLDHLLPNKKGYNIIIKNIKRPRDLIAIPPAEFPEIVRADIQYLYAW